MNVMGRKLTEKESTVYCALVKYSTKNDRELSEITGINLSTVTAIRRRLEAMDYYHKIRLPMVQHIGAELLTISYGELGNTIPRKKRDELCDKYAKEHDNIFLFFTSEDFAIIFNISKNYTELKRDVDELQHFLSMNKILTQKAWNYVMFPFEVASLINYFDFSYAMSYLVCKTPYKIPHVNLKYRKYDKYNLTNKEKAALESLVNNPSLADNAVAKIAGLSRQTLSNMRQKFQDNGLLQEINVPDLRVLKGILVFSHMLFNPDCMLEDRKNGVKFVLESSPSIFLVSGSFESALLHIVTDYEEFSMLKNKLLSYYSSKNFLRGEGSICLMPTKELKIHKYFDFSGILKNIM